MYPGIGMNVGPLAVRQSQLTIMQHMVLCLLFGMQALCLPIGYTLID
jgi:hypothetical protein